MKAIKAKQNLIMIFEVKFSEVKNMAKYNIQKELKDIHTRMYGTNFEQDRIVIEDAIKELEKYQQLGTIEEIKDLKDKSYSEWKYFSKENMAVCNNCSYEHYLGTYHQYERKFCPKCGSKMNN